ncbi:MAG TPA: universal stress protein [Chryseosolibacter sp.]|nr:universal stress protein [Chryseosolibacter sp.]
MVNILVPTDFSDLSKVAVRYAAKIASKLDGNITLLHVIDLQRTVRATMRMDNNIRDHIRDIRQKFEQVCEELALYVSLKTPVKFKVSKGNSFNDTVLREAKRLRSGLIVMGTKGASGIKKTLIGSNTASVLGASHIPVLAVPERAEFKSFRNVVYATDLKNLDKELTLLVPYIERFGSTIHILHVLQAGGEVDELEEQIEQSVHKTGYKKFVTLVTVDFDVDAAIDQYVGLAKADLVTMFTHKPTFYEKLLDRSVTRKRALHSKIPLLAFRQE